jgi:mono/diheme cytochrome c family protein
VTRRPVLAGALATTGAIALAALVACGGHDVTRPTKDAARTPALIARGQYLTTAADCAACHTLSAARPFAGGLPFKLPFGTVYSTNITADRQTGIGAWSDDDFVRALQQGVAKGGRHLYPAFPYTSYTALSRDDAVAIKAYLFSLPTVHAPARANSLSFPFNQRWGLAFWNAAFLRDHRFRPDPALSTEENRGAYLASALGHCGECHTPRNLGYAMKPGQQFAGTMLEGWRAYNITGDRRFGVGGWSDRQLGDYLSTGHAEGRGSASGPMSEVVEKSLQHLAPEDIRAMVAYLRQTPARPGAVVTEVNRAPAMLASAAWGPGPSEPQASLGARIFQGACASCHQWNGQGQETAYAALAGSQAANDPDGVNLTQVVLKGASLRTPQGTAYMPAFSRAYSDQEIAAVANYVIGHFGGRAGRVTPADVARRRAE